jgi:hypothetical protein
VVVSLPAFRSIDLRNQTSVDLRADITPASAIATGHAPEQLVGEWVEKAVRWEIGNKHVLIILY